MEQLRQATEELYYFEFVWTTCQSVALQWGEWLPASWPQDRALDPFALPPRIPWRLDYICPSLGWGCQAPQFKWVTTPWVPRPHPHLQCALVWDFSCALEGQAPWWWWLLLSRVTGNPLVVHHQSHGACTLSGGFHSCHSHTCASKWPASVQLDWRGSVWRFWWWIWPRWKWLGNYPQRCLPLPPYWSLLYADLGVGAQFLALGTGEGIQINQGFLSRSRSK